MTERITQSFEIIGGMELIVEAVATTTKRPIRIEECHGEHRFNEDEVKVDIVSVKLCFDYFIMDITHYLSDKEKELIANELEVH